MIEYNYLPLDQLNPVDLITCLNQQRVREHLIEHELFSSNSIKSWINEKVKMDSMSGCKVRGIVSNKSVAGWCGIQLEGGKYEIAIVLDENYWGLGKKIFNDMMDWAKELGHKEVFIHFLHTRPEYRFLRKNSKNVFETVMFGRKFTTYQLPVNQGHTRRF